MVMTRSLEGAGPPAGDADGRDGPGPRVIHVPVESLRTSLQPLRGGCKPAGAHAVALSDLPLRVATAGDGSGYEVLDGFKRLARWRALGARQVPVVIEPSRGPVETYAALLLSNSPPRTLTPMDEARVVFALRHEAGLGPATIAKLLGRKRRWVFYRLALAERLSPEVAQRVDAGRIGVTLAHALCAFKAEEQETLCAAAERHRLKSREALALVAAFRVAEDDDERRRLLAAPLPVVRPERRSASPLSALGVRIDERLDRAQEAIEALADFRLPEGGLTPAERRRLEARHRAVMHQLFTTARGLATEHLGATHEEEEDGDGSETTRPPAGGGGAARPETASTQTEDSSHRGAARRDQAAQGDGVRHAAHRKEARPGPQGGPPRARGDGPGRGPSVIVVRRRQGGEQARPLPGADPGQGQEATDRHPHPAGDPRAGIHRRAHDPG
jgi:hypothetical protein